MDNMEDVLPFCICTGKLGFRVITPLPRGHAIVGTSAVQGFVSVLQKLMGLTACLRRMRHKIKEIGAPLFDSGVYHAGRCIRLPHTYKVDRGGGLSRQLRLFVCHPEEEDKHSYVTAMLRMPSTFKTSYITHCTWCSSLPSIGSISQSVLVSETASSSRMWLSAEGRQKVETALSTSISGTGCPRLHGPGPWPV